MTVIDPVRTSRLQWDADDEAAYQRRIQKARDYHEGTQFTALTPRLREFLNVDADTEFVVNVAAIVVRALVERLKLTGCTAGEDATQAATLWQWWQANRMDRHAADATLWAVRDGESMVLVDWDERSQRPRFTPHQRYVDPQRASGDGDGMRVHYQDENPATGIIRYATKRWTQVDVDDTGKRTTRQRITYYYPDRIERYVLSGKGQEPYPDAAQYLVPWVDADSQPLGVPVAHLRNAAMRPEAVDAWPVQDAINKGFVDLLAAEDVAGFRILAALGFIPTTDGLPPASDGSNALQIQPGMLIGTTNTDASLQAIDGADVTPMVNAMDAKIRWLAMITDTPLSRFTASRQIAAEGTLKQQEGPLIAKGEARQVLFGDAWEDAFALARRIANVYGRAGLDETVTLQAQWAPIATRDDAAELATATQKAALGVPRAQLWAELGYSQEQIAVWQAEAARRAPAAPPATVQGPATPAERSRNDPPAA